MKPIVLIHGYSSEGKDNTVEKIYGDLPQRLEDEFGKENVRSINLSRWISLNNGIRLDDVSYAMDRALKNEYSELLSSGFHVIIHSTGALVVRNWIKNFSPKPCPIDNFVHLAGANFGSGLAHIGRGKLSRWGRYLFNGTGVGTHILNELEFGSWKTLDLHHYFLEQGNDMFKDYQVREFCIIGSQTLSILRAVPIRYVKEDSADNTVRTSAGNLNFNYISIKPTPKASTLTLEKLENLLESRRANENFKEENYEADISLLKENRQQIPFTIAYETAHYGDHIGIVSGDRNRKRVIPLIVKALNTENESDYNAVLQYFENNTRLTFQRAAKLKNTIFEWNKQSQYEGHAQLIFRLRDQFGNGVKDYDLTFKSKKDKKTFALESMIEDEHTNQKYPSCKTLYLRTQKFNDKTKTWENLLDNVASLHLEVTALECESEDISYVPINLTMSSKTLRQIVQNFTTTVIDIEMMRLPSAKVFAITPYESD